MEPAKATRVEHVFNSLDWVECFLAVDKIG